MKHAILLVALALLTTSCVPIPPEPTDPPELLEPRVPVGLRDLATGLSKYYGIGKGDRHSIDEYYAVLYELIRCYHPQFSEEELYEMLTQGKTGVDDLFFSSSESMALTIFNITIFMESTKFADLHEPPKTSDPQRVFDSPEYLEMYMLLEHALEVCERR